MNDLNRLLRPKSIAIVGGGAWCRNVITQCEKFGYQGAIWIVHPKAEGAYRSLTELPSAPDATFIGVNRDVTIEIVRELNAMGAGGAVCFASGFLEATAEDAKGADLQAQLLDAAGDMPFLGPNCYGFINALDGALLWPDQHGCIPFEKGVAIVTQSSNIAINLTMQTRALPIAYIATAGNQAKIGVADLGKALLADDRVTALGLHIEGFGDLRAFEALATEARHLGKPIIALKVGKSEQARAATVSHTASLAGGDAGASALLKRLGIGRASSLPAFLETLKLLHVCGPLPSNRIASISCSGGEASLVADMAVGMDLEFPPLSEQQSHDLRSALGPMVALANPLDYHTYIWTDAKAMTAAWSAMMQDPVDLTMLIVDFPRTDRCSSQDWECAIQAALVSAKETGRAVAMVSSLQETLPEDVAHRLMGGGVVPLMGISEALEATEIASWLAKEWVQPEPLVLSYTVENSEVIDEATAKSLLAVHGVTIPQSKRATSVAEAGQAAQDIGFPIVLKCEGIAHKTEVEAVKINLNSREQVAEAASQMPTPKFLVEEMITGTVAEILIGVVKDPAHGFVLTLAAGGTLTEVLQDGVSLLVPSNKLQVGAAFQNLKIAPILNGYRGQSCIDMGALVDAVMAVQAFLVANADTLEEVEINPMLCSATRAVAADALIRMVRKS